MNTIRGAGFRPAWYLVPAIAAGAMLLLGQQPTYNIGEVSKEGRPTIAMPDLRGTGEAQALMPSFNQTLWADVLASGTLKQVPKTMYPTSVPQQPGDFTQPPPPQAAGRLRRWRLRKVPWLLRNGGRVHGLGDLFQSAGSQHIGP